jgi:hypothetical protein
MNEPTFVCKNMISLPASILSATNYLIRKRKFHLIRDVFSKGDNFQSYIEQERKRKGTIVK